MEKPFDSEHQAKLKFAAHRAPGKTLADTLAEKTVAELRELSKHYHIKRVASMKKADLILALSLSLQNQTQLATTLFVLPPEEWSFFLKVADKGMVVVNSEPIASYYRLQQIGCLQTYFFDNCFYCVVPLEIRETYVSLRNGGIVAKKSRGDLLHAYAMACMNLYGIISQDDFVALFNSQNEKKTTIDEVFSSLLYHVAVDAGYCFWEDYIVCDIFEEDEFDGAQNLLQQIQDKPRYIPQKEELLKYADEYYFERTKHVAALEKVLIQKTGISTKRAADIATELCLMCRDDAPLSELLQSVAGQIGEFTETSLNQIADALVSLKNNSRIWVNNGHTPEEILGMFKRGPVRKTQKVGRNELCPCGSGKKYKKCCGRND